MLTLTRGQNLLLMPMEFDLDPLAGYPCRPFITLLGNLCAY